MSIDANLVDQMFCACLLTEAEEARRPPGVILAEGITGEYGFHPDRLEGMREQVTAWLSELPDQFFADKGGGWSFLNLCTTKDDEQWTGLHGRMEQLVCLSLGLGLMAYLMPRAVWKSFPGGMPYVVIKIPDSVGVPAEQSEP